MKLNSMLSVYAFAHGHAVASEHARLVAGMGICSRGLPQRIFVNGVTPKGLPRVDLTQGAFVPGVYSRFAVVWRFCLGQFVSGHCGRSSGGLWPTITDRQHDRSEYCLL